MKWKMLLGISIIAFLIITRFGFLNWGAPWYFHPDERNVASAVVRIYDQIKMSDDDALNPHFFAYGGLPIYVILGLTIIVKQFYEQGDPFVIAILISRIISATWMMLVPILTWKLSLYWGKSVAKYSFLISIFCVGYIQFARFGAFESWLTFNYLLLLLLIIKLYYKWSVRLWFGVCLLAGVGVAIKVPSLYLLPLIGFIWFGRLYKMLQNVKLFWTKFILLNNIFLLGFMGIFVIYSVFIISNPYAFSEQIVGKLNYNLPGFVFRAMAASISFVTQNNWWRLNNLSDLFGSEFLHSINVERAIALGKLDVFYTRHFKDTVGGLYQIEMILPWITSIPMVVLSVGGIISLGWSVFRKNVPSALLLAWLSLQLIFIFPLYVKWTRYMIPVLPAIIVAGSVAINQILWFINNLWNDKKIKKILKGGIAFSLGWHLVYTLMFVVVLTQSDTRIEAADWMRKTMNKDIDILSEVYDLGILPFNSIVPSSQITLYNFYDMDNLPTQKSIISPQEIVSDYDVIVILSRRVWKNSIDNDKYYPQAANFYAELLNGKLGFIKVQEFSNYPRFGPLVINDEINAEETFSVFDHPRIQIWVNHDKYDKIMI